MDDLELQKVLAQRIFMTQDEAALDALSRIAEPKYELGGIIYQDKGGRFLYSAPQGDQKTGKFSATVSIPASAKVAGIYHTHPEGHGDPELFSPDDVRTADAMKLASYIKALSSGNVRKYMPGATSTRPLRAGGSILTRGQRVSEGELMRDPLDIARGK